MNPQQIAVCEECSARSLAGTIVFPDVVAKLAEIGVERYHIDYARDEATFYHADGTSHRLVREKPPTPIAAEFSAAQVEAAIRASQRGEINYQQFVERTRAAGCVGYFVQITGRRALYFGRLGDVHTEPFPTAKS